MFVPVIGLNLGGVHIAVLAKSLRWRTAVTAASVLAGSPAVWLPAQALVQAYRAPPFFAVSVALGNLPILPPV